MIEFSYLTAFLVGLLGGVHCVGMCGGIVGALTLGLPSEPRQRLAAMLPFQLAYNLGRALSYVVAGAVMGALGMVLAQLLPVYYAQRLLLLLAGLFKDAAAGGTSPIGWMPPFLIAGVSCLVGAVIMLFTRSPQRQALRTGGKGGAGSASHGGGLRPQRA